MPKLKVFRTPIGFHDAYVAAPSQKAALEAWGSDANLFARGAAEQVTDAGLMKAPLAQPGKVVRVMRSAGEGSFQAESATTPGCKPAPTAGRLKKARVAHGTATPKPKPARKPRPRPSRAALDKAEEAIGRAEADFKEALAEVQARERAIREERGALHASHATRMEKLAARKEKARKEYRGRIEAWADG